MEDLNKKCGHHNCLKNSLIFLLVSLSIGMISSGCNTLSIYRSFSKEIPFPKTTYCCVYEECSDKGKPNIVTVSSNGTGYMVQSIKGDHDSYSIFDNLDQQMYFFDRRRKNVECWPLQYVSTPWMYDEALYKSSPFAGRKIGEQIIENHSCNAWLSLKEKEHVSTRSYFDKITGCLVRAEYKSPSSNSIIRLKSYAKPALEAQSFQIPNDYKLTIMGSHTL